jgi:hypothetical protein
MAKQARNVVTHGLSGKVGDLLVFRQVKGQTIVSNAPKVSKKLSEKQQAQRRRFSRAVIYAKAATGRPESKEIYDALAARKGRTPFTVAVADFLNAPEIRNLDLSHYTGQAGDAIRVEVSDDAIVKRITVSITNADGSLVEEGDAQSDASGHVWTYTATQANANLAGDKIVVTVHDLPDNITQKEQALQA